MVLERWHPITRNFGLIRAPMEEVVAEFSSWQRSIGIEHSRRELTSDLAGALATLPPLSAAMRRRLFVATSSEWIGFFQSGIQGSDPFPPMSFLAGRMKVMAMRVCSTMPGATWPAVIWELYEPGHLLNVRRSISAMNDGGRWVFQQHGEPFPFEKSYDQPRKRDRFTHEMLVEYTAQWGIRPFDDDFFVVSRAQPAILLERPNWPKPPPEFTLDEVVSGKPWE